MENLNKRPSKGILRFSESSRSNSVEKDIKWDEANIKETLHPDDKDYGFMKIDEPPTPYRSPHGRSDEDSDEEDGHQANTKDLLERVSRKIKEPPVVIENVEHLLDPKELEAIERRCSISESEVSIDGSHKPLAGASSSLEPMDTMLSESSPKTPQSHSRESGGSMSEFEIQRKRHYNEFHAVQLAKKLMQKELDDDDDDDYDGDADADNNEHAGEPGQGGEVTMSGQEQDKNNQHS